MEPLNRFKPSSKIFILTVPRRCFFVDHYVISVLLYFHARLFVDALWSPAGKGLTSWLSFVMSIVTLSLCHWYSVLLDCIDS